MIYELYFYEDGVWGNPSIHNICNASMLHMLNNTYGEENLPTLCKIVFLNGQQYLYMRNSLGRWHTIFVPINKKQVKVTLYFPKSVSDLEEELLELFESEAILDLLCNYYDCINISTIGPTMFPVVYNYLYYSYKLKYE